jgi:hypothetical protein
MSSSPVNKAYSLLGTAEEVINTLSGELEALQEESTKLASQLVQTDTIMKYAEIVDTMINDGLIEVSSRQDKVAELVAAGVDPEVFKSAMAIAPNIHTLGHLDNSSEETFSTENPLERAIMSYVQSKNNF